MWLRIAVALCVGALFTPAHASFAAPVACELVKDSRDDANENPAVGGAPLRVPTGSVAAADVISADLASDARVLTGVVRLSGIPAANDSSPTGYLYEIRFDLAGETLALYGKTGLDGDAFDAGSVAGPVNLPRSIDGPRVTGVMDKVGRRVVIHAPWQVLEQLAGHKLRPGTAASVSVYTYRAIGSNASGTFTLLADVADSQREYVLGTRSCVRPGVG